MHNILNDPDKFKKQLNDMIDSPEMVADYIADVFECPITIEDANHRVVSYSKHHENIDEARISTIMNRRVPNKVINGLWKRGVMPKLIDNDDPVIIPEIKEIGLGNRVAVSIRKKNQILGFIWAHTADKKLGSKELLFFKEAAMQVKIFFLQRHPTNEKTEAGYIDFFWQLMTGDLTEAKYIYQKAQQLHIRLDGRLAVAIIQFPKQLIERVEKHAYYLSETQVKVDIISRLFDDNNFIMIVRLKDDHNDTQSVQFFIQQFIEKISTQLQVSGIQGACGFIYDSPVYLKDSYEQALKVIDVKHTFPKELNSLIAYEDLGIYEFIQDLSVIRNGVNYQNPRIERLRTYDVQHNTSLLSTLYEYLRSDSNPPKAAKKLFIHPNTMNYRLKRIREIADLDLDNTNQKTAIYIDFLIENLQ
ncbi:DNA-binding transcriptional regulator, PucR family [Lentibacillus persicus]|uniref:DNA-binding transcriptional regulator, PucR family n=1 Tax=Lentibacillus persicus TaxID=640948 RepID=A0A1I1Y7G7_9BACI|nr:helix-turn-helix domain-containing protein [Lentibacillus persicus]SFE15575.1 DNA-binding transcriptional regulator, PucR family [Lentibacillus persicus]